MNNTQLDKPVDNQVLWDTIVNAVKSTKANQTNSSEEITEITYADLKQSTDKFEEEDKAGKILATLLASDQSFWNYAVGETFSLEDLEGIASLDGNGQTTSVGDINNLILDFHDQQAKQESQKNYFYNLDQLAQRAFQNIRQRFSNTSPPQAGE